MTKVTITGATGFIGRHVLAEFATRGMDVVATTRALPPDALRHAGVRWVTLDVASPPENAFAMLGEPDVLLHLAWGGLPNYRSLSHFEAELPAHYAFLKQLADSGLKSMLVAGTCFEYGLLSGALSETDPAFPVTAYGLAKDMLRRQLEFLQADRGASFDLTWARLFFVYGDGQAHGSLYSQLRQAIRRGDTRFLMSGGEQLRDYMEVSQVARVLVSLALAQRNAGIVNVCSGKPRSVRSMVEGWLREHRSDIDMELGHYPYPDYEPMAFWGASSKLERLLEPA